MADPEELAAKREDQQAVLRRPAVPAETPRRGLTGPQRIMYAIVEVLLIALLIPCLIWGIVHTNQSWDESPPKTIRAKVQKTFVIRVFDFATGKPTYGLSMEAMSATTTERRIFEGYVDKELWETIKKGTIVDIECRKGKWGLSYATTIQPAQASTPFRARLWHTSAFASFHKLVTKKAGPLSEGEPQEDDDEASSDGGTSSSDITTTAGPEATPLADGSRRKRKVSRKALKGFIGDLSRRVKKSVGRMTMRRRTLFGEKLVRVIASMGDRAVPFLHEALEEKETAADIAQAMLGSGKSGSRQKRLEDGKMLQQVACGALGQIASEGARRALLFAIAYRGLDPVARGIAAKSLGELKHKAAQPALMRLLTDDSRYVRRGGAIALGHLRTREAAHSMNKIALNDDSWAVRQACAEALGKIGNRSSSYVVLRLLKDKKGGVRAAAAQALGLLGSEKDLVDLTNCLKDTSYVVRKEAATALGRVRSKKAVPSLRKALKDPKPQVRLAAAEALHHLGDRRNARRIFSKLSKHSKPSIRSRASAALKGRFIDR